MLPLVLVLATAPMPFRDEAAGFDVMFVGAPGQDEKTQAARGVTVVTHRYTEEVRGIGLVVSWTDHPESKGSTPEERLVAARDTSLDGETAILDVELSAAKFGAPGREFTFEHRGVRISQRVFVRGIRLYQVLVVRPVGALRERAARTFLDSFHLLPETKPAPSGKVDAGR